MKDLLNPLAWPNVRKWSREHSSRIVFILLSLACVLWLFRRIEARLIALLARRAGRGTAEDRENRSRTLIGVVHNAAGVIVFSGGIVMLLNEAGIVETGKLMSWLAVIGLAVAFGAQSLVKDFFSGFMILLEQQYMVNDVVKIDDVSGQVERITLRMTVLRDWEGCVHFIPHGEINRVSNSTQGWSRAVFNIGVAYGEDIDHVMNVLADLARQMREEPEYGSLILEDMEMLGVDELGESAVVIRFVIKTRPLKKWLVRRELLAADQKQVRPVGNRNPLSHAHARPSQSPSDANPAVSGRGQKRRARTVKSRRRPEAIAARLVEQQFQIAARSLLAQLQAGGQTRPAPPRRVERLRRWPKSPARRSVPARDLVQRHLDRRALARPDETSGDACAPRPRAQNPAPVAARQNRSAVVGRRRQRQFDLVARFRLAIDLRALCR